MFVASFIALQSVKLYASFAWVLIVCDKMGVGSECTCFRYKYSFSNNNIIDKQKLQEIKNCQFSFKKIVRWLHVSVCVCACVQRFRELWFGLHVNHFDLCCHLHDGVLKKQINEIKERWKWALNKLQSSVQYSHENLAFYLMQWV